MANRVLRGTSPSCGEYRVTAPLFAGWSAAFPASRPPSSRPGFWPGSFLRASGFGGIAETSPGLELLDSAGGGAGSAPDHRCEKWQRDESVAFIPADRVGSGSRGHGLSGCGLHRRRGVLPAGSTGGAAATRALPEFTDRTKFIHCFWTGKMAVSGWSAETEDAC